MPMVGLPSHRRGKAQGESPFSLSLSLSLSLLIFYKMNIIVFSFHFCYLFDRKMDEGLIYKIIVKSGLKFTKLKTGV
jgi:hypothetical protein